jgi:hypothetical protein
VSAIEKILAIESGMRILSIEESTLSVDPGVRQFPDWKSAPRCSCEICDDAVHVHGDHEGGWWVDAAKITLLVPTAQDPTCDVIDGAPRYRMVCQACLDEARTLLAAAQKKALLASLRECETLAREIELTDSNRSVMGETRRGIARLIDWQVAS